MNQLLALVPLRTRERLTPHLEAVHLDRQQILSRAHEPVTQVFLPTSAVISLIARVESGQSLEVGQIGRNGVVGVGIRAAVASSMSCDAVVQIPGAAYRLDAGVLRREMAADAEFSEVLARYAELLFARCTQLAACNTFHSVEQRTVRWLLGARDVIGQDSIPVTHELLAVALGVHRQTVTLVLNALSRAGLVHEERGRVFLTELAGMERASCDCYRMMRAEQLRLLGY